MKKVKLYVSGPYTKGDQFINTRNAILASDELMEAGVVAFCPHLSAYWNTLKPHTWQEWMDYDLVWVEACDALLRLPGESKGADIEVDKAKELGLPVFYSIEEAIKWAQEKEKR